jgi:hypothetical protein
LHAAEVIFRLAPDKQGGEVAPVLAIIHHPSSIILHPSSIIHHP